MNSQVKIALSLAVSVVFAILLITVLVQAVELVVAKAKTPEDAKKGLFLAASVIAAICGIAGTLVGFWGGYLLARKQQNPKQGCPANQPRL
jgi:Na+-translocating ferredoxin:NAD+ oxidoreductase RnfA subunit